MIHSRFFHLACTYPLTLATAAALVACGGGSEDSATAQPDGSAPAARATAAAATTTTTWTKAADEWGSFKLSSSTTVRYGAGTSWITKTLSGTVNCTSGFFGSDPAPGVFKACDVAKTTTTTTTGSSSSTGSTGTTTTTTTGSTTSGTPTNSTGATVSAKMQATRVTGVAPLAVLFDASGTTSSASGVDTFRQVGYSFNFGDERGQAWATTGASKNVETGGPIAAHVFEVPGTYTVKLRATDPAGGTSDTTLTVTVQDPAVAYASTKTVCVSAVGDYTGCPSGAAQAKALPTGTAWNGKRVLLKRGETFGDVSIQDGNSSVIVDVYGSGNLPVVNSVGVGSWRPSTTAFATDITVANLSVANGIQQSIGSKVLFLRNEMTGSGMSNGFYFGNIKYWAADDPWRLIAASAFTNAREIFLVENKVTGSTSDNGYNVFGDGSRVALLGNVMGTSKYHTVRLRAAHKTVIAHNELRGISGAGIYHALKVHSGGLATYADAYSSSTDAWATDQLVVTDNLFGNAKDNNQWTVAICPENDQYAEGLQNVVVSANRFVRNPYTAQDLTVGGRSIAWRSNTVTSGAALKTGVGHVGALPTTWNGPYYAQ